MIPKNESQELFRQPQGLFLPIITSAHLPFYITLLTHVCQRVYVRIPSNEKEEHPEPLAVLLMLNIAAQFFQSRVEANPPDV